MGLTKCPDCGGQVSDQAPACPHCGRPAASPTVVSAVQRPTGTQCPKCGKVINPVVTNVGGGSCSVGSRERWTCPACRQVIYRKGCFVATATYGDEDFLEVQLLRAFRDTILRRSFAGRAFISAYYRFGPYVAWLVERIPGLRKLSRSALDAVVSLIERHTGLRRAVFRKRRR